MDVPMSGGLRLSAAACAVLTLAGATLAVPATNALPGGLATDKTEQYYVVAAHPDDETLAWSFIERIPESTYQVWVLMTRGEATDSCLRPQDGRVYAERTRGPGDFAGHFAQAPAETGLAHLTAGENSSGAYKYEGPESPVGEDDEGERHPFGFPWVGQRSEACAMARIASYHWFLDGMNRVDGSSTDMAIGDDPWAAPAFRGRFCPDAFGGALPALDTPRGFSIDGVTCAEVWATPEGARVVFEHQDQGYLDGAFEPSKFTPQNVTNSLQWLRRNRAALGIAVLPEAGMFNPARQADGVRCPNNGSSDHGQVSDALRYTDQGAGPQSGMMACPDDPYGDGAEVSGNIEMNPATLVRMNLVDPATGYRIGPINTAYGWLAPGYVLADVSRAAPTGRSASTEQELRNASRPLSPGWSRPCLGAR